MNGVGDGRVDIKQLPYLSVVQSKVGSYGISLDGGAERFTGDGGFFIAPSVKLQKITHLLNKETDTFCARYIFLGVTVNRKYRLDDLYDFPLSPTVRRRCCSIGILTNLKKRRIYVRK